MTTTSPDTIKKSNDIKDIGKKLKNSLIFICIFILFKTVFALIVPYYINMSDKMTGPIDARVGECCCFDQQYVQDVKKDNVYKVSGYQELFVPMDLVFPVLYTMMFLTLLNVRKNELLYKGRFKKFYDIFFYTVYAGMIFDYLENLIFFLYLKTDVELSLLVAILTTIKTLLFVINILGFIIALVRTSVILLKNRKLYFQTPPPDTFHLP